MSQFHQIEKSMFYNTVRGSMTSQTEMIVVTTGGTIEKIYDETIGSLRNQGPQIDLALRGFLRLPGTKLEFIPLMSKDSLDLKDSDRSLIALKLKELSLTGKPLIVLHGTDTMVKTMKYCSEVIEDIKVPIVFTGSMRPYGIQGSDAIQNVTESLFAAKYLDPGIFMIFHSQIFSGENIVKNYQKLTFEYEVQS